MHTQGCESSRKIVMTHQFCLKSVEYILGQNDGVLSNSALLGLTGPRRCALQGRLDET